MTVVVTLLIVKHYGKLFDSLYTLAMVRVNYHTLTRKMSLSTPLAKVCPPSSATTPSSPWPGTTWTPRSCQAEPVERGRIGHAWSSTFCPRLPCSLSLTLPLSLMCVWSFVCCVMCFSLVFLFLNLSSCGVSFDSVVGWVLIVLWGEFCSRLDLALPIFPYVSWLFRLFCSL